MAHPLWWALALASLPLVSGARYVDYSESKMPDYGSAVDYEGPRDSPAAPRTEADDYHEHMREIAVPAEYKYVEDRVSGKADKHVKEVGEPDEWQNSINKQKKKSVNENQEIFDNYSSDELPSNFKSNYRPSKHRPRVKSKNPHNEGLVRELDEPRNKHAGYNRNREKDIGNIDSKDNFNEHGDDLEDDKDIDFEEERVTVRHNHRNHDSDTTLRTARRKPRDRYVKSEPDIDEEDPIDNIRRRPLKDEFRPESATRLMRRPQYRQDIEARPKDSIDKNTDTFVPKKYDEYSEYYDMKRAHGIKEKLFKEKRPLIQTTSIRPFRRRTRTRARNMQTGSSDGVEGLRRLMNPHRYPAIYDYENKENKIDEPVNGKDTTNFVDDFIKTIGLPASMPSRRAMVLETSLATTARMMQTTSTIPFSTVTTIFSPRTAITAASTTISVEASKENLTKDVMSPAVEETLEVPKENTTNLSLAEKSRLSILKKAQRKEMLKGTVTKKPPVLLQVTNVLHTLVMVEPPTSLQPWQRVSVVHEDTPNNVLKVKRMMRQKLVDNAKDVHDLAENWDDMVCDYIDMALLEAKNASTNTLYNMGLLLFSFMAIALL